MNYVIAAWLSCGAILVAYAAADVAPGAGPAAFPGAKGRAPSGAERPARGRQSAPARWLLRAWRPPASSQAEVSLYPRRRQSLGTRRQRVVAAVVIVGALGFLIERGLANAIDYYLTANQAVAQRAQLGDKDFRIQGTVLPGVRQVGTTLHSPSLPTTLTSKW